MNQSPELLKAVRSYRAGGASVIPINWRTKRPALKSWAEFQTRLANEKELSDWADSQAFAIVGGKVSGGVELLDFDANPDADPPRTASEVFDRWRDKVGHLVREYKLPVQATPGNGFQVYLRCPEPSGNQKLAWIPDATQPHGRGIAIETRGEGGYALVTPSLHPSGGRYEMLWGDLATIPLIPQSVRDELMQAARELDEMPCTAQELDTATTHHKAGRRNQDGNGVIQAYNERYRIVDVLRSYGYTGDGLRLSRPNQPSSKGVHIDMADNIAFPWSSNDPLQQMTPTGTPKPVDPFAAFCLFEHNGDVKAAVRAAAGLVGMAYTNGNGRGAPLVTEADLTGAGNPSADDLGLTVGEGDQPQSEIDEADKELFTDLGNARRFARLEGPNFRYTHQWGWLAWTGQCWAKDETGLVMRAAKRTATGFYSEAAGLLKEAEELLLIAGDEKATEEQRTKARIKSAELQVLAKQMTGWAKSCQARARLEAIIKLSESELPIATKTECFDSLPWTLNVENGTIDLHTGQLRAHNPGDMLTTLAPVHFDPAATCPLWLAFLLRIMNGSAEMVEFLQRVVGYALTGDVSEQVLFFLWGGGSNGKSTLMNILLFILGEDYAIQAAPELLVVGKDRHPTEVADLYGKRLVASIEVEDGRRLAEGLVKQMTGGDKIKARLMRQDFFQFDPTHKLFLVANHRPVVKGTDYAIWRRIRLIPFEVTISDEEKDPQLPEKLKTEASGILAWAVRGCLEWQRRGLGVPEMVKAATEAYRVESDTLSHFLEERTVQVDNARTKAKTFYEAYKAWCEESGERALTLTALGKKLTERGFEKDSNYLGVFYLGIGLVAET